MGSAQARRKFLSAVLLIIVGLWIGGCGRESSGKLLLIAQPPQSQTSPGKSEDAPAPLQTPLPHDTSASAAIVDLDALACPQGVDEATFASLKSALKSTLSAKGNSSYSSAAPEGPANVVQDLAPLEAGPTALRLKWKEVNAGDYDLNGEVNVADITPLGVHFGKTRDSADWAAARVADGDGNGEINLGDITPIGSNFMHAVAGYRVYRLAEGQTEPDFLGSVLREQA